MTLIKFLDRTGGFFVGIVTSFAVPILQVPFAYILFWKQTKSFAPELHWFFRILLTLTLGSIRAALTAGYAAILYYFGFMFVLPLYGMMIGVRDGLWAAITLPFNLFKHFEKHLLFMYVDRETCDWKNTNFFDVLGPYFSLVTFPFSNIFLAIQLHGKYHLAVNGLYALHIHRVEYLRVKQEEAQLQIYQTLSEQAQGVLAQRMAHNEDPAEVDANNRIIERAQAIIEQMHAMQTYRQEVEARIMATLEKEYPGFRNDPAYRDLISGGRTTDPTIIAALLVSIAPLPNREIISVLDEREADRFEEIIKTPEYEKTRADFDKYKQLTQCPTTLRPITDPVTVIENKSHYVYEHNALKRWIELNPISPISRAPLITGQNIHRGYPPSEIGFIKAFTAYARDLLSKRKQAAEEKQLAPAAATTPAKLKRSASASTLPSQAQLSQAGITLFPTAKRSRPLSRTRSQESQQPRSRSLSSGHRA